MFTRMSNALCLLVTAAMLVPCAAFAQDAERDDDDDQRAAEATPTQDPQPVPPRPNVALNDDGGVEVKQQAGAGGVISYASEGVVELGGSAGFTAAGDLMAIDISPSIGWFIADNFELSAIVNMTYAKIDELDATTIAALIEPSYHLPFTDTFFGFFGIGAGVQYAQGAGTGLAIRPRLGVNLLVGRSGIFTPSLHVGYSTVDTDTTSRGTVLTVEPSVGFNAGYTVMW